MSEGLNESGTLHIRIAAVFVILAASLTGGLTPLYIKIFRDLGNPVARMLRAAAAGIIICLGFIHMLQYGVTKLNILAQTVPLKPSYNPAGATAIFGVLLMMVIEGLAHGYGPEEPPLESIAAGTDSLKEDGLMKSEKVHDIELQGHDVQDHGHKRGAICINGHGSGLKALEIGTFKQKTLAHMFELGCVVHSVILGISLGVIDSNYVHARTVFIALCFHQLLEGCGLGTLITVADFPMWKGWALIVFYALTTPVGVAIGIGISSTYNPQSITATAVEGTLNSFAAGILLYMGLVQMVAVDFAPENMAVLKSRWAKIGCYVSLTVAAACMSILPIWA